MKIKKLLVVISTIIILSMLLAGCGEAAKTGEETKKGEPVTIQIFVGIGTGDAPEQVELHKALQEEFNSSHKDIQIEFLTTLNEEARTKFSTMLASGQAPDLVMPIGIEGVANFEDEWLDISHLVEEDNYDMSDFNAAPVKGESFFGLPIGIYPSALFYNVDLYDAAGVEYPPHEFGAEGWTYDALVQKAQLLTLDANGNNATSPDFDPDNIVQFGWDGWDWFGSSDVIMKFGGNLKGISADYKTAELTGKSVENAYQFVYDTVWKYYVRPNGEQVGSLFSDDPMSPGIVANWEIQSWIEYAYPTWNEAFNWDMAAIPSQNGIINAQADFDIFTITKSSKHPKEAWEVAKWLIEPEQMKRLAPSYGCIPSRKSLAEGWLAEKAELYPNVDFQVLIDSMAYADFPINHEGWTPAFNKVVDAFGVVEETILESRDVDVKALLDAAQVEIQGYLDEYWAGK